MISTTVVYRMRRHTKGYTHKKEGENIATQAKWPYLGNFQ